MDEPVKTFDLSPEQQDTTALIQRLLGKRIADRYVDFCRLAKGAFPLRVSVPMAAHALRELDSIIRQTLEAPMEVTITPSQEEIDRIENAKVQLRSLGFTDDEIQRVANELRPRLSHKQQIAMIVVRLGLAADGDIARAWHSISQANTKAHGGRALHQSVVVDDTFRAEWQAPFDNMIRGLMIALEGQYGALMRRVDQLAAMPDRGAAVTSFSKEIPGALPLLWRFFNQLQTPDWLPHLAKRNLLAAPLSLPDDTSADNLPLRQWPAGRYLLRMAQSPDVKARFVVAETLRNIEASIHPDVQQTGIEILAALPAAEAATLIDLAEAWLTPDARFIMAQAPHDLIKTLLKEDEAEAALRVARAVFKVFDESGKLATLSRHMYEHYLPGAVRALAPTCREKAVGLLADLLDQAALISGKVCDDPPYDYSYYLSGEISELGTKYDVIDALVGEVVHAAKLAIEIDPACTREVIFGIRSHSPKIFTRLALHVLSLNPVGAPDLAQAYLTDTDLIEASWCRSEYGELARSWFPSLPSTVQQQIFSCVDSVPAKYRDRWRQRFEEHEKRSPTPDDERNYDTSIVRDLLWHWRTVLPANRREDVEKLGDPDAWRQRIDEPAPRPPTAPDFLSSPIDDIVVFLETWRPSSGERRETATVLGQELRNSATANPALYSANASRFAHLPPIYVRNILQGLDNAAKNRNDLDWQNALALIAVAVRREAQPPPSGIEGDDPDWSLSRKAAAELLASGLRQGANGLPFAHRAFVQSLILDLYHAAPRLPDTDDFEVSYRSFPHFGAQSTSRGAAVELAILLIFWLSKDKEGEIGKVPREALSKLPEIRQIFETELGDRTSSGRIPRAVMGRYLNWFYYFAEGWLRQQVPVLFPADELSLRDATWLAHLSADSGPNSELAPNMRDCYVAEINSLAEDTYARDHRHVDDRLAEYLIILYINAAFPDELFELFWNTAPLRSRQHAMWFLGVQLELPSDSLPDDLRARAFSYWDRRLKAAKASSTPDYYREEIGTIGQYFFRQGIPDEWLMEQVVSISEAGFAPRDAYSVMDRLSKISPKFPGRTSEALAALVKNPRFDRWVYMTQSAAVRTILENGLGSGSPVAAAAVMETINYLSAIGDTSYLDLLPSSKLNAKT